MEPGRAGIIKPADPGPTPRRGSQRRRRGIPEVQKGVTVGGKWSGPPFFLMRRFLRCVCWGGGVKP